MYILCFTVFLQTLKFFLLQKENQLRVFKGFHLLRFTFKLTSYMRHLIDFFLVSPFKDFFSWKNIRMES